MCIICSPFPTPLHIKYQINCSFNISITAGGPFGVFQHCLITHIPQQQIRTTATTTFRLPSFICRRQRRLAAYTHTHAHRHVLYFLPFSCSIYTTSANTDYCVCTLRAVAAASAASGLTLVSRLWAIFARSLSLACVCVCYHSDTLC